MQQNDIQQLIQQVFNNQPLDQSSSKTLFSAVARGEISEIELAGILLSMKTRGETSPEIAGIAQAFLQQSADFPRPDNNDFADIVGTGGDGANTFNISVTSAIVASCCGAKIIKHGSRSVSSKSGASDLLTAFDFPIDLSPQHSRQLFDKFNFCFLFAPLYHSAFKYAATVRQQLKTRTIFNLLGPLVNPAHPKKILLGVYSPAIIELMVNSLQNQQYQHAIVVHGDGIDEVNLAGVTKVAELQNNQINYYSLTAADFGLNAQLITSIKGDTPEHNKLIIENLLQGKGTIAQQQCIAANVALLLKLFGHNNLKQNAQLALATINSGQAYSQLQQIIAFAKQLKRDTDKNV